MKEIYECDVFFEFENIELKVIARLLVLSYEGSKHVHA